MGVATTPATAEEVAEEAKRAKAEAEKAREVTEEAKGAKVEAEVELAAAKALLDKLRDNARAKVEVAEAIAAAAAEGPIRPSMADRKSRSSFLGGEDPLKGQEETADQLVALKNNSVNVMEVLRVLGCFPGYNPIRHDCGDRFAQGDPNVTLLFVGKDSVVVEVTEEVGEADMAAIDLDQVATVGLFHAAAQAADCFVDDLDLCPEPGQGRWPGHPDSSFRCGPTAVGGNTAALPGDQPLDGTGTLEPAVVGQLKLDH